MPRFITSLNAKRLTQLSAVPAALVVGALLVWNASNAAFTSTTANPGNSWATGTVA